MWFLGTEIIMRDFVPRFSMSKFGDFPFNWPHLSHSVSALDVTSEHHLSFQDNTESLLSFLVKITRILWRKNMMALRNCLASPFTVFLLVSFLSLQGIPLHSYLAANTWTKTKSSKMSLPGAPTVLLCEWHGTSKRSNVSWSREACCLLNKKIICWQFTIGWIWISEQDYDREIKTMGKAFRNGCSSGNMRFLYLRTLGFIYPTWVIFVLKGIS